MKVRSQAINAPVLIIDGASLEKERLECVDLINNWECPSIVSPSEDIIKSDWAVPQNVIRPYSQFAFFAFTNAAYAISAKYKVDLGSLTLKTYWFQQYNKAGFHDWHTHKDTQYNCVWFLELPEKSFTTEILGFDGPVQVDAKQGDIIVFPSCYSHRSAPNKDRKTKTSLAFNI